MRAARVMGVVGAILLMAMAGLALSAPPTQAQALFGTTSGRASQGGSIFYSIDPATGAATRIGPVGFSLVSGIAFHPTTGVLYAVGFEGLVGFGDPHVLLTIDKATGAGTTVGPTNVLPVSGCDTVADISFRSDGTLYAYTGSCADLGVIDTTTGAYTSLGRTGVVNDPGNGIAFSPGNVLFHAGRLTVGTLDQTTGVLTPGPALTFPGTCPIGERFLPRVNALDFQPGSGTLFAMMNCSNISWRLGTIDTATGVITDIGESAPALDAIAFESPTDFRDVRRPNGINIGLDLGGTRHPALNFTGNAGAAGDTWITVYDPAPNPPPVTFGSVSLSADVLIHAFNNKKGAGLLALYNEAPATKGLALTLYNAGNTDTLVLATLDQAGKLVTLKSVSLGAGIAENVWYRVHMDVTVGGSLVSVIGTVFRHETPTEPDSPITTQVGATLTFSATLGAGALIGVDPTGEVGVLAAAVAAANSSSVTNITIEPQGSGTSCLSTSRC